MAKEKRKNVYFRQTSKSFRADRQTRVFSHINRLIPYTAFRVSKNVFDRGVKNAYEAGKKMIPFVPKKKK